MVLSRKIFGNQINVGRNEFFFCRHIYVLPYAIKNLKRIIKTFKILWILISGSVKTNPIIQWFLFYFSTEDVFLIVYLNETRRQNMRNRQQRQQHMIIWWSWSTTLAVFQHHPYSICIRKPNNLFYRKFIHLDGKWAIGLSGRIMIWIFHFFEW